MPAQHWEHPAKPLAGHPALLSQRTDLRAVAAGAAGVLLHVGQGNNPGSVHARLRALLGCLKEMGR